MFVFMDETQQQLKPTVLSKSILVEKVREWRMFPEDQRKRSEDLGGRDLAGS